MEGEGMGISPTLLSVLGFLFVPSFSALHPFIPGCVCVWGQWLLAVPFTDPLLQLYS